MRTLITAWVTFLLLGSSALFALHRDYKSDCEEDNNQYQNYYDPHCLNHAPGNYQDWLSPSLAKYIPAKGPTCCKCNNNSVYVGYLDPDFRKYRSHLTHQLEYYRKHSKCHCYWPEYSSRATEISDKAYLLFRDLIATTALSNLLENEVEQKKFIDNLGWFLNKHGLTISFIAQQFRFSDYYHIYKDIDNYALANYSERDATEIRDKLQDILEALYPKFFSLYTDCHAKHPSHDVEQEIRLMKLLVNDISALENSFDSLDLLTPLYYNNQSYDVSEFIISNLQTANFPVELENKGIKTTRTIYQPSGTFEGLLHLNHSLNFHNANAMRAFSIQSEILVEQGTILNSFLLYKEAIEVLTQAIKINSYNREAYIERAMAYFETNQIELALKDYKKIKQLAVPPFKTGINQVLKAIYIPKHKYDFTKGLIKGALWGARESAEDIIPSIFSSCRGILYGLWAFASSPSEFSQEMIDAAYAIGEFLSNHDVIECLECVIPELKDISYTWHQIDDYGKGKKIGAVIGKYGVEIFAPLGAIKGIAKLRALKRANTMFTLERCAVSGSARKKILEKSAEFVAKREVLVQDAVKTGSILIKTENVVHHVMQEHHCWEKVIQLSGNKKENFRKVISLLEENKINDIAHIKTKPVKYPRDKPEIIRTSYVKEINGCKVEAVFETYLESGETFLKDAWVITKS